MRFTYLFNRMQYNIYSFDNPAITKEALAPNLRTSLPLCPLGHKAPSNFLF
jgi:hypothetical protein